MSYTLKRKIQNVRLQQDNHCLWHFFFFFHPTVIVYEVVRRQFVFVLGSKIRIMVKACAYKHMYDMHIRSTTFFQNHNIIIKIKKIFHN